MLPATEPPPSARPLYIVSGLAFVPLVGIAFGFIGLCWGLVSERPRAMRAAVIGALGLVLNLGGCFAFGMWAVEEQSPDETGFRGEMARVEMLALINELEAHHRAHRVYPARLTELQEGPFDITASRLNDSGISLFQTGQHYQYRVARDKVSYVIFSAGADGRPGTPDDIYPVLPDSLEETSGFRIPADPADSVVPVESSLPD